MSGADRQIMTVFCAALEYQSPQERAAYLDEACGDDAGLRARVEALLQADCKAGNFLGGSSAPGLGPSADEPPISEAPGMVIGPYKLLEEIGEGGFGVVFMAEQTQPVRRKVALKVLKPGMDSRQVVARFEAERQALALMDHPNIAKIHDGGATPSGRPYFVMELVKGVPITEFCDHNRLTPRERLLLFVPVCQAIQHAHQKGIIHRDLKPANVLVSVHDTTPVVKVIDFGVAKALGQQLTDKTLFTGLAQIIGTPLYMSPEQAGQSGLDIDTRSDIYALGVLLYELLTGTTPFDQERLRRASYEEMCRIIREEEPPRPSTRISTLGQTAATVSVNRQSDPKKLGQFMRGELDWIVMKALEKDRNRRYETASAFAADVQRYLNDEPVEACPPSAWYRFRKLSRRHKGVLATAALVSLVVLLGVVGLAVSNAQIRAEQKQTREEQRKTEEAFQREKQTQYYQCIALAAQARTNHHASRAEELLDQCPARLRGWEWHYLKRLPFARFPTLHHPAAVTRLAFSPDGQLIVSGTLNGVVKIWHARTGAERHTLPRHDQVIQALAFSPDGQLLATSGEGLPDHQEQMVRIWNPSTGELLGEFPGQASETRALAFSPGGRLLAAAFRNEGVRLWDVVTRREVLRLPEKRVAYNGLAFRASGQRLTTVREDGLVKTWDVVTGETVSTFHADIQWVWPVAFSPSGRLLAMGSEDGTVKVWETDSGKEVHALEAHASLVTKLAFGADDRRLASAGDDRTVKLWDLATGQEALREVRSKRVQDLAFSPDGHRLLWGGADGIVGIWDGRPWPDAENNSQGFVLSGHLHKVVEAAFSPDGKRLASASWDKTVKIWDLAAGKAGDRNPLLHTLSGHRARLTGVAFSPDGRRVASSSWDETVKVWDASSGQEIVTLSGKAGPVYGVAFHPNPKSNALASAHHDGTVRVWNWATGQQVRSIQAHEHAVLGVAFSPDGQLLASAGGKAVSVGVWKAASGENLHFFRSRGAIVWSVAFSPKGQQLASAMGRDGIVRVWDVTTGAEQHTLKHGTRVVRVAFSPDRRRLATVSQDQDVRLYDPMTGQELGAIRSHVGDVWGVAFSPDGRRLAACSGYKGWGEIRLWDTAQWEKPVTSGRR
jgi:WD40 repeat protein/serine/threonine protein kinase